MITQERLKELLYYCPSKGVFTYLTSRGSVKIDSVAKSRDRNGYIRIQLDKTRYQAHRLVWLYVYGRFPNGDIDHINKDKGDNRLANLRDVTHQENLFNTASKGYSYHKQRGKYVARIGVGYKQVHLGLFTTQEEAGEAYLKAKEKYHKIKGDKQ